MAAVDVSRSLYYQCMGKLTSWRLILQYSSQEIALGDPYETDDPADAMREARARLEAAAVEVRPAEVEERDYSARETAIWNKGGLRQSVTASKRAIYGNRKKPKPRALD